MSGCCGQGPVIVSGAAATPRVDVETVLLCDTLTDGTVAAVALLEPIYDTSTGARVGTRTVDPVTGAVYTPVGTLLACQPDGCNATTDALILCDTAADGTVTHFIRSTTYDCTGALLATLDRNFDGTAYTPAGTVGVCPVAPDCDSPTEPTATVGLCLADGTPIAVTVVRDCTGAVTSEGWINLTTGAYSAGAPPVGTVACGESRSIQVSGTFCDVDAAGDVVGLVLVEYTYDDTGAIASVRLVDATTGGTYTPTGTVTACPSGTSQPEQDLLQLCDTAADGTVTAFVRDYRRDETGVITGHSDYSLDGAAYAPAGTVGVCQPSAEACRNSSTVLLCDAPADTTTTITPTITDASGADAGLGRFPDLPGPYTSLWSGGTLVWPANPGPAPAQIHPVATGLIAADLAGCDGASGTLNVSVRVTNTGPGRGQAWDGALQITKGTMVLASRDALHDAPAGWSGTLSLSVPVTAADVAAGDLYVALVLETFHLSSKAWTADQFTMSLELDGCEATSSTQFLRTLVTDCETGATVSTTDTTLDGQPYTVTGEVGQCTPAANPSDCNDCDQIVLCDTVAGIGTHTFLRTVCRDCNGVATSVLDTELDGTTAYLATGTVGRCCDTQVVSECGYSLPDTSTGWNFADPAFPSCWVPTALNPSYTYGNRVTSWAANYRTDTGSAAVVLFSSTDLGGAIDFSAFSPALPVSTANSATNYVGTVVINGVTVTLTATAGDGLARWSANNAGLYLNGTDAFRLDFSQPVRLAITTSAFGDPLTVHERFCGVVAKTVPWPAVRLADCDGNVTTVDATTRGPLPAGATVECSDSPCLDCQTLVLCDDGANDPATLTGLAASGTLSNGVAWTAKSPNAFTAKVSNADGSWWGQGTFPNPVLALTTWTFDRPVEVEFSVELHYVNYTDPTMRNAAQLPAGAVPVSLPAGYSYNAATGVVTVDSTVTDCAALTDPRQATSARFRLPNPVTSFSLQYLGSRVAACGVFDMWRFGSVTVTPSGQFLRTVCRDCSGAVISTSDTGLDAVTPYTPLGAVGVCQPPAGPEPVPCCQPVQVCIQQDPTQEVEFISNEGHLNDSSVDPVWTWTPDLSVANPPWYDMYGFQYSAAWSVVDSDTARPAWWVSPHPTGGIQQSTPALPNEGPTLTAQHWYPRAFFDLPDNADPATIKVQATVFNADQLGRAFRLNGGAWQALPATATHNGTTYTFGPDTIPGAQAGRNFLYLDVEETVGGGAGLMVHLKVFYDVIPETRSWTRMVCCDDSVYYLDEDGQRQDTVPDGWHVAPCGGSSTGGSTDDCAKQIIERCGCDDADGDGIGDVLFTELWAIDPCGGAAPVLVGTYQDGDPAKPYTPVASVDCTVEEDDEPSPLSTGVQAVTGTAAQDLAGAFPGLQSVSLTVLAGAVNVTLSDGAAVPIPAGVTMTWSVAQDEDSALAAAAFAGASPAAAYLLNYTYR